MVAASPELRRTSYSREDRNVNLGVINVPVRAKTTTSSSHNNNSNSRQLSSSQTKHDRSHVNSNTTSSNKNNNHQRSSSVSHARSGGEEYRDGPPTSINRNNNVTKTSHHPKQPQHHSKYELDCDYDNNPTVLYDLVESSAWDKVRLRCRTHPEEVRTWIIRRNPDGTLRWRLLPLHAAIIFQAPSTVVSTLLERYPVAAMRRDDHGMLPLHLAFRHKQEDEGLLELLLLEHPKAVHEEDRRHRIPLMHGKESMFTAKLMKLYANAAMSTVNNNSSSPSKQQQQDHYTQATPTTAPSSPMANAGSVSLTHLHRVEAEHEAQLAKVKADHHYELEQLKNLHQDELASLKEDMNLAVGQVEQDATRERRIMQERHAEEVDRLRLELEQEVGQRQAMQDDLQKEILQLHVAVEEAKHQEESMAEKYGKLVTVNVQMKDFLQDLADEQVVMQDLAQRQQDYLEAARMIRTELVQTLLKQEDSDGANERLKGTQMIEIGDRVQRKIKEFVKHNVIHNDIGDDLRDDHIHQARTERKGPSRIEMEREDRIYSTQEGATEVQAATPLFADSQEPDESVPRKNIPGGGPVDSYFEEEEGDLEMLADEVSAITENSGY
ncbi:hypothetical protein MPSEU_000116700 [Mayamaea pseudoterrestris]|nr:hypothetical protein MPSEU_000116700 [Mayamaea pseudoterrestris]